MAKWIKRLTLWLKSIFSKEVLIEMAEAYLASGKVDPVKAEKVRRIIVILLDRDIDKEIEREAKRQLRKLLIE